MQDLAGVVVLRGHGQSRLSWSCNGGRALWGPKWDFPATCPQQAVSPKNRNTGHMHALYPALAKSFVTPRACNKEYCTVLLCLAGVTPGKPLFEVSSDHRRQGFSLSSECCVSLPMLLRLSVGTGWWTRI